MAETIYTDLKQLGGAARVPQNPDEAELERVANPQGDVAYAVRFTAPEFTSLCPMTGQPDFAHLVIDYVPGQWLVESNRSSSTSRAFATTAPSTRIAR